MGFYTDDKARHDSRKREGTSQNAKMIANRVIQSLSRKFGIIYVILLDIIIKNWQKNGVLLCLNRFCLDWVDGLMFCLVSFFLSSCC